MNLNEIRQEREKWLTWKNIAPLQEAIRSLKTYDNLDVAFGDRVTITIPHLCDDDAYQIEQTALLMKPWRKGPFQINDLFIDTEWQSHIK